MRLKTSLPLAVPGVAVRELPVRAVEAQATAGRNSRAVRLAAAARTTPQTARLFRVGMAVDGEMVVAEAARVVRTAGVRAAGFTGSTTAAAVVVVGITAAAAATGQKNSAPWAAAAAALGTSPAAAPQIRPGRARRQRIVGTPTTRAPPGSAVRRVMAKPAASF